MEKLVAAFRTVNLDGLPSLASMSGDRERILWVLLVAKEKLDERHLTAPQASAVLRDVYGIHVPWQRAQAILAGERDTVAAQRRAGRRYYQLMQPGTQAVVASGPDVVFIEPDKALSGIRSAQAVMQSLVGTVRFCDPYVESSSLDLLAEAVRATDIRLLTVNIARPTVFARDLAAFRKEHGNRIEVRQAPPGALHDRYAVDDARALLFGTSLSGLGKKQSFIVELGEDMKATVSVAFDGVWNRATVF